MISQLWILWIKDYIFQNSFYEVTFFPGLKDFFSTDKIMGKDVVMKN